MPNLFPARASTFKTPEQEMPMKKVRFGRSRRFDFNQGDFVVSSIGKVAETRDVDAWLEWCRKALMTARYRFLVYSRNYGQEFEDLIARHLSRGGNESEIKRIAIECLMVDPRTAAVENFSFRWDGDKVYFTCEIKNIRGESDEVSGSVVI